MSKTTLGLRATALNAALLSLFLAVPAVAETAGHGAPAQVDHGAAQADHGAAQADHGAAQADHGAAQAGHGAAQADHGAAQAHHDDSTLDQVVATVGGKNITLGHMMVARAALPQQYQMLPNDQLWDGLLEQLIQQEVLAQSKDAHETPLVQLSMSNERRSLLAAVAITAAAKRAVTEARVLEIYQRDYVNVEQGKEYDASHILLDTEQEALDVLAEIKAGADFATVARERSTGPSGPNGGALGWFSHGMMVKPFETAVESLSPGDVTGPVQTQFGWHVIKLNDTRSREAPLLDDVRPEIVQKIQQEAVEEHISALMRQVDITRVPQGTIDPAILSNTDLLEN